MRKVYIQPTIAAAGKIKQKKGKRNGLRTKKTDSIL